MATPKARELIERLIQAPLKEDERGDAPDLDGGGTADYVRQLLEAGADRIVVETHMGSTPLPVIEVWESDGTIHLTVEAPQGNPGQK